MALKRLSLPYENWVDFLDTRPGQQLWSWGGGAQHQAAGTVMEEGGLMPGGNPVVTLPSRPQQPHLQDEARYHRTSMQGCEFVWQLLLSS